jgi:hypothetical protein
LCTRLCVYTYGAAFASRLDCYSEDSTELVILRTNARHGKRFGCIVISHGYALPEFVACAALVAMTAVAARATTRTFLIMTPLRNDPHNLPMSSAQDIEMGKRGAGIWLIMAFAQHTKR